MFAIFGILFGYFRELFALGLRAQPTNQVGLWFGSFPRAAFSSILVDVAQAYASWARRLTNDMTMSAAATAR